MPKVKRVNDKTDGANELIESVAPYMVSMRIEGVCDLLFHRWNCESVAEKAKAPKNSKIKKTDDVETFVWRDSKNNICIPGEYLRQAMINAAKSNQDPRSPRKSAADLFKAGVVLLTNLSSLGTKKWDYLDTRRVTIQRQGINRTRPAMSVGWKADFDLQVITPEYITPQLLHEVVTNAGKLVGVGDFRPTYGRFVITNWKVKGI
jgi:hypothetical protein